jgi:WD40 repeat protein/predicted ATPase
MLTLRSAIGLTQVALAAELGVSRQAVSGWEAGQSYPKAEHLKQFIELAVQHQAFPVGGEDGEIRALWRAARQRVLLDEQWLRGLLREQMPLDLPPTLSPVPASFQARPLPLPPTPYIGRETELAQIAQLLVDPACRVITICGPGGIGKTRLALEVAARQGALFAHGVAFVELAPLSVATQIVPTIGEALGLSFDGQAAPTEHLLRFLQPLQLLLVLDNLDHLADGAYIVNAIVQATPRVTIVATSRERLNLRAEWMVDLDGLAYPQNNAQKESGQALPADPTSYSAVRLFVQQAQRVQPSFHPSANDLEAIMGICQQVSGMPLAIELVAAWIRVMSVDEIAQQVYDYDLLTTTLRDVPPRHRSLHAVFDHSWAVLSEHEQALLARLAVFRGGGTLIAAHSVASATARTLAALIDKSLVRGDDHGSPTRRFTLLEPIREYALHRLEERGERAAIERAHAAYYLALAETTAAPENGGVEQSFDQVEHDYDNLRAALYWAVQHNERTFGLRLAEALWLFWRRRGSLHEGRQWLADLLALGQNDASPMLLQPRPPGREALGWLASDEQSFAQAVALFEQGFTLQQIRGRADAMTDVLISGARQARGQGDYAEATQVLERTLAQYRALVDEAAVPPSALVPLLQELAMVLREQGDYGRGQALWRACLKLQHAHNDRVGVAVAQMGLSDIARDQGDTATVRTLATQSLAVFRAIGEERGVGYCLNNLALAAFVDGDLAGAAALVEESVTLFSTLQGGPSLGEVLLTRGRISAARGRTAQAREDFHTALRIAWAEGPRWLLAATLEAFGGFVAQYDAPLAARLLGAAAHIRQEMRAPLRLADRAANDHAVLTVRAQLGTQRADAIWAEAATLPLEQSIGEALAWREPEGTQMEVAEAVNTAPAPHSPRVDWGDALDVSTFYGREAERALLAGWIVEERCRLVGVLGMGGIGKSALVTTVMRQVAAQFDVVIWRSLRDSPSCEALVDSCLQVLVPQALPPVATSFENRLQLLMQQFRTQRVLLVLDNGEVLLEDGNGTGRMHAGFEAYERLLQQVGATTHNSCLLLTSREKPAVVVPLEGRTAPVRTLQLMGLDVRAGMQLLEDKEVVCSEHERVRLVELYQGNPLALKIVAQTIVELFGGEIATFLAQGELIFGGVRELLDEQFTRLSGLEQTVLLWLAVLREPVSLDELMVVLSTPRSRTQLLEAVEGLRRRSLLEQGQGAGSFTLQSVVLEYATARLIIEIGQELEAGQLTRLLEHGLCQAQAKDYVRQTQEQLLVTPLLTLLRGIYHDQTAIEARLLGLLDQLRTYDQAAQGYGPANLVILLRLLRGHLRDLDLSGLALRGAFLQGTNMQDTDLSDALLRDNVFTEPLDAITLVTVSATGAYWALATRQGDILIWDATGQPLRQMWHAHTELIWALAFSSDERRLASASTNDNMKVWDIGSGTLVWERWAAGVANSLVFSPDNDLLVSGGLGALVRFWNAQDGTLLRTYQHTGPISTVAWSPDGRLLASGCVDGSIWLWQPKMSEPETPVQSLREHTHWVTGLTFSPDSTQLASASRDGTVKLWDVTSGACLQTLLEHTDRVQVAWSPDGRILASGSYDATIKLWDLQENRAKRVLQGHTSLVNSLAFTPDSQTLLSGGQDGTLRVWDVESGKCLRTIEGHTDFLLDFDWSPDGDQIASYGVDLRVTLWDATSGVPRRVLPIDAKIALGQGLAWGATTGLLATGGPDAVEIWNPAAGVRLHTLRDTDAADTAFQSVAWNPDGRLLAAGTYYRGVQVWDVATWSRRWVGQAHPTRIRRVAWSPDGRLLAGGGYDGIVYLWDAGEGTLQQQLEGHAGPVLSVAWSPDGQRLASAGGGREGGQLFVWDVGSGERVQTLTVLAELVSAVAWSPSTALLISGDGNRRGTVRWWNVESGQCLRVQEGHHGTVQALKISPDGSTLASCGDDGAIRLWDSHTGEMLRTLRRDRPYERLTITGVRGLVEAQKASLRALGAVEDATVAD